MTVWKDLRTRLGAKRARINRELAFYFAGWATGYAREIGATSIAIEDLSTLEARGIGRINNNKVAQSARRKAVDATTHLGARVGPGSHRGTGPRNQCAVLRLRLR